MAATKDEMSGTLILGRYRVVQPLARGGMGVVYLARTEGAAGFTRPVVVKRIIPDLAGDETTAQAFVREARILANLQHPGIVNVIDFDEDDGAYVMVLEYVHGYNVGQWHRYIMDVRKQMPVDHAIYIVTHVLEALHYAHTYTRPDGTAMQIVHRDVSPGNILIDTQGHVKLLDFGIARANEGGEYKTRDGMFKGKLAYSAPEVYDGKSASPKSDVYSVGVVLYQLLSGENPFRGKDVADIVRRVLSEKPGPIAPLRADVSPALDAVLQKALSKDPAARHPTAAAFADELRNVRPNREEDFATELADEVWNDFNGDMPQKLGLEPLQTRDAAWRAAAGGEGERAELRSTPPPLEGPDTVAERSPTVPIASDNPTQLDPTEEARRGRLPLLGIASAVVAMAAVAIALFALLAGQRPQDSSRFVVVEKETREEATAPVATAPGTAASGISVAAAEAPLATAEPGASAGVPGSPSASPELAAKAGRTATAPNLAALSHTVQRQRGRMESCFLSHAAEINGRPEVSVRFHLASSGHVNSAELSPSTLGGTALGQCLLTVARSTDFGPISEPVVFTVPLDVRVRR